ncbi:MAG: EAL domain-containing protein [Pseudomonadota bacterium]|nr:EAL domain-containing protein [Pseudomonadota bacterium]
MRLPSLRIASSQTGTGTQFFRVPLTIALAYALAGFLWIHFSDRAVERLFATPQYINAGQTLKGWFFVATTAAILFLVLRGVYRRILEQYERATASEQRLELALASAKGGIWDRDLKDPGHVYVSPQLCAIVGLDSERPVSLDDWTARIHPLDNDAIRSSTDAAIASKGRSTHDVRYRFKGKDGTFLRLHSRGQVICDEDGTPARLAGIVLDETEQALAAERINRLMAYDSLTGLANRGTFIGQLDETLERSRSDEWCVAVAQILIHDFNELFDEYGDDFSNKIIQVVGNHLGRFVEGEGLACRLGNDSFAIAVPHKRRSDRAHKVIKLVANLLGRPITIDGRSVQLSYSVGAAMSPQDGASAGMLIANSYRALSKFDAEGRDSVHWFTEGMDVELRKRMQRQRDLRHAIENTGIICHYQPIIDMKSGSTIGFEALARWLRPGEGMVPPQLFIQLAEDTGYIRALGEEVLRQACRQAAGWKCSHGRAPFVAVNVSARQLDDPEFPELVQRVLEEEGLPPSRLELEITENAMTQDTGTASARLESLRDLGVSIALDDFGTGYSCLSILSHLPFNRLKIDRSFTREYGRNVRSTEIVHAILVLSRALGMSVTVEGVETPLQSSMLHAVGVGAVQGFHFSRAVDKEDIGDLLECDWSERIAGSLADDTQPAASGLQARA